MYQVKFLSRSMTSQNEYKLKAHVGGLMNI